MDEWSTERMVTRMKILNFGSLNLDYTYQLPHIVMPGETITSLDLQVYPGGKGLNQSVALAKAGADVYHAGLIGADGGLLKETCEQSGVNVTFLRTSKTRSGNAIIQVDENGQNSIILYPGANRQITREFVDEVLSGFQEGDVLLLQNEINELPYIIDRAYEKGMQIVLNPSPFDTALQSCNMERVSLFLVNEVEGFQMTGEGEPDQIVRKMQEMYPNAELVLTLGSKGSLFAGKYGIFSQPIFSVKAVDTTGAGDTFTGYFVTAYYERKSPKEALLLAAMASAIAVTRKGAAVAVPTREEVEGRLKQLC